MRAHLGLAIGLTLTSGIAFVGCGDDSSADVFDTPDTSTSTDTGVAVDDAGTTPAPDTSVDDATPDAPIVETIVGRCDYQNAFSSAPECKAYTGAAWDEASAADDCAAVPFGTNGSFVAGETCGFEAELGRCTVDGDDGYLLVISGDDPSQCSIAQTACDTFIGGAWAADPVCEGGGTDDPPPLSGVFIPPYLDCREPMDGEPMGDGPDGSVCTQTLISACTEPGRRFADYASCDVVVTQRPYYAYPVEYDTPDDDPRLEDEAYMGELAWITEQVEACACTCCHSSEDAPSGSSGWYIEAGPLWIDTVDDDALAMLAGLVDSSAFGTYPPEENNGFDRATTGLPTTDIERMQTFLVEEYLRRGNDLEDAEAYPAFGGPLYTQSLYEPEACTGSRGLADDGTIEWGASGARYVYVLEADAANPGVPPNLDLPEGTIWRIDVDPSDAPIEGPIQYGQLPDGASQAWPLDGDPPALEPGKTYYVYVLLDVGVPVLRCLSTLEG